MLVKNTSDGPRGLYVDGSVVMLAAGEVRELDAKGGDLDAAKRSGWFEFGGTAVEKEDPPEPDADLDKLTDDELRAFLGDRGVKADGRWGRDKLIAEAEKVKAV